MVFAVSFKIVMMGFITNQKGNEVWNLFFQPSEDKKNKSNNKCLGPIPIYPPDSKIYSHPLSSIPAYQFPPWTHHKHQSKKQHNTRDVKSMHIALLPVFVLFVHTLELVVGALCSLLPHQVRPYVLVMESQPLCLCLKVDQEIFSFVAWSTPTWRIIPGLVSG